MGEQVTCYHIVELNMDTGDKRVVYTYVLEEKAKKVISLAREKRKPGSPEIWGIIKEY